MLRSDLAAFHKSRLLCEAAAFDEMEKLHKCEKRQPITSVWVRRERKKKKKKKDHYSRISQCIPQTASFTPFSARSVPLPGCPRSALPRRESVAFYLLITSANPECPGPLYSSLQHGSEPYQICISVQSQTCSAKPSDRLQALISPHMPLSIKRARARPRRQNQYRGIRAD